jgi:sulfate adenylyltransferase subunit 2
LYGGDSLHGVTVAEIVEELKFFRRSERENRVIDYDQEGSMELKKREGYF